MKHSYYDQKKKSGTKKYILSTLFILSMVLYLSPRLISSALFERYYGRTIYPSIARVVIPPVDKSSVSFSLLFIVILGILLFIWLVISWRRRKGVMVWFRNILSTLFGLGLLAYVLFFVLWGANYHCLSVEELFNLNAVKVTQADVENFLDRLEPILCNPPNNRNTKQAINSVKKSLKELVELRTGISPLLPRIKRLPKGSLIRFGNSSGISSPYLLEAHVDAALSDVYFVKVAAHELAHIAGFAGEADAEFVSALAALCADNDFTRYSAALDIYISLLNRLEPTARKQRYDKLPELVKKDIKEIYIPFNKYSPPKWFGNLQKRIYGMFLKTQGVSAGYSDYSRDIKLLIIANNNRLLVLDHEPNFDIDESP